MAFPKRSIALVSAAAVAAVVLAACGSSGGSDSAGGKPEKASASVPGFLDKVKGMDQDARFTELQSLAKAEGDTELTFYTTCSDCENMLKAFTAKTGIKVNIYSADDSAVMQRIDQENKAGKAGADIVWLPSTDMHTLSASKSMVPFTTPISSQLLPGVTYPDWVGASISVTAGCWNTDALPNGPGATWEDVLKNTNIKYGFEVRQVEWFEGIVNYLEKDKGYTEDDAIALFKAAAKRGHDVNGQSLLAGNIGTGLYDEAMPGSWNICGTEIDTGAPVAKSPMVSPAFGRPIGPGMLGTSMHGAADLLLIDYVLSLDTQTAYVKETGRVPTQKDAPGALPAGTDLRMDDESIWSDPVQTKKWTDLYAEVLKG